MNLTSISLLINALENVNLRIGCEFEAVFVNLTPCPRLEHQIYLVGPPDLSGGKCANRHSGAASGTAGAASGTAGVPPARSRRGLHPHTSCLSVNVSRQGRKALRALAGGTPAVPCWGRGTPAVPGCSLSCKSRNSRTARFSLPMNAIRHTLLYRGCRSAG